MPLRPPITEFRMDHGVAAADRRMFNSRRAVCRRRGLPGMARPVARRFADPRTTRPGVALEQRRQPRDVDVVGVLVGDHDRGQAGETLEAVREGTGVESNWCCRTRRAGRNGRNASVAYLYILP